MGSPHRLLLGSGYDNLFRLMVCFLKPALAMLSQELARAQIGLGQKGTFVVGAKVPFHFYELDSPKDS